MPDQNFTDDALNVETARPRRANIDLGSDPSLSEIVAAARESLSAQRRPERGAPLPFGRQARKRRSQRAERTRARRQQRHAFAATAAASLTAPAGTHTSTDEPDEDSETGLDDDLDTARRPERSSGARLLVISALVAAVLAVLALALKPSDQETHHSTTVGAAASPPSAAWPSRQSLKGNSPSSVIPGGVSPQPAIPPGGASPVTPPGGTDLDAADLHVVDPPRGAPTPQEMSTPDGAARAWLARWCPFSYTDPFGSAENRARLTMTESGWTVFNPIDDQHQHASWERTVAARESARCTAPDAFVVSEASEADAGVVVVASINRVITAPGQTAYVERLTEVRVVRCEVDGSWRVDLPTTGG